MHDFADAFGSNVADDGIFAASANFLALRLFSAITCIRAGGAGVFGGMEIFFSCERLFCLQCWASSCSLASRCFCCRSSAAGGGEESVFRGGGKTLCLCWFSRFRCMMG